MASNPDQYEVWYHANANTNFIVYQRTRAAITAKPGVTVANQISALLSANVGAVDKRGVPTADAIYFLETLPIVS